MRFSSRTRFDISSASVPLLASPVQIIRDSRCGKFDECFPENLDGDALLGISIRKSSMPGCLAWVRVFLFGVIQPHFGRVLPR